LRDKTTTSQSKFNLQTNNVGSELALCHECNTTSDKGYHNGNPWICGIIQIDNLDHRASLANPVPLSKYHPRIPFW
jgi:hypothetical protein